MVRTRVGYAGGRTPSPTYRSMGDHTEVIQIDFDPEKLSFLSLLDKFWGSHSPWRTAGRGQYRTVLLVQGADQREQAEASAAALARREDREIATPIENLGVFTRAEGYHQKYALRRSRDLTAELTSVYGDGDGFTDSTVATRLNAYLAGYGSRSQLERELPDLGLSPRGRDQVRGLAERLPED